MGKKNSYMLWLNQKMNDRARIAQFTEARLSMDALILALNAEFGFGHDRIDRLFDRYIATRKELADFVFDDHDNNRDKEFIYARTKIDRSLQQIMGPDYPCHEKRYLIDIGKPMFDGGIVIK